MLMALSLGLTAGVRALRAERLDRISIGDALARVSEKKPKQVLGYSDTN